MATSIERNTIKLLEQQRDALFAQQEEMKQQMGLSDNQGEEYPFGGLAGLFGANALNQSLPSGRGFLNNLFSGEGGAFGNSGGYEGSAFNPQGSGLNVNQNLGIQQPYNFSNMQSPPSGYYTTNTPGDGLYDPVNQGSKEDGFMKGKWGDALTLGAQALPGLYNLGRGALEEPQHLDASKFYNKYEGRALGQLQQAQPYDISSQLANVTAGQNAFTRNATRAGSISGGSLRSNLLAGSSAATRQRGDIYAQKENIEGERDIQRRQQLSQMLAGFGRDRSQIDFGVQQINDQNRAAQTRMLGQGVTDLSRFGQNQQLMSNQKSRDEELRKLLPQIYEALKFTNLNTGG